MSATSDKPLFFSHADAHIDLSNEQLQVADRGAVSGALMFASARFNAWLIASGAHSLEGASASRESSLDYLAQQYREMLADNLDDYLQAIAQRIDVPAG